MVGSFNGQDSALLKRLSGFESQTYHHLTSQQGAFGNAGTLIRCRTWVRLPSLLPLTRFSSVA